MTVTVEQIKAARRLLKWSQVNLAIRSGVGFATVRRIETRHPGANDHTFVKLQAVLEAAGIEFFAENGGGAGVRLKVPRFVPVQR